MYDINLYNNSCQIFDLDNGNLQVNSSIIWTENITDIDQYFKIDNVPSGEYEIVFWQEKLSTLPAKKFNLPSNTIKITVNEEGSTIADFTFDSPANYKKKKK